MKLRTDETTIKLDNHVWTLRPSLWASLSLYLEYDGLDKLAGAIAGGKLQAFCDLMRRSCTDSAGFAAWFADNEATGFVMFLKIQNALIEFVGVLAGATTDDSPSKQPAEPMSHEDYFAKLFQIGTGWLGWSPAVTWAATPAEILNAYQGKLAMLKAIHGGPDDNADDVDLDNAKARAELNALGDTNFTTMQDVRNAV